VLSQAAANRLRKPLRRGAFRPIDAARRQLALLTVADEQGQSRIYWLVDPPSRRIEDARFLAFGDLGSHPVADAFCEAVRGRTLDEMTAISLESLEAALRDEPNAPAFGDAGLAPLGFVRELQVLAVAAAAAGLTVPPKPIEKQVYSRKREADWDQQDRAWLPLSLLRKIARVQQAVDAVLAAHTGRALRAEISGLHDDFRCVVRFSGLQAEEVPTLARQVEDRLKAAVHPGLVVEGEHHG
jgi:NifU-like protein involved in Fe-S cluster formation